MIDPTVSRNFLFTAGTLPQKLSKLCKPTMTGYWYIEFVPFKETKRQVSLFLTLFRGQVVCSSEQMLSWPAFIEILGHYLPKLRDMPNRAQLDQLSIQGFSKPLEHLYALSVISQKAVSQALWFKLLSDFDQYSFNYIGQANFFELPQLEHQLAGLPTFEMTSLAAEAKSRQAVWSKLRTLIPSMKAVPILQTQAVEQSSLTEDQKQRLKQLVRAGNTLSSIAEACGQDSLEIAKIFAKLVNDKLVNLRLHDEQSTPSIFIVDDSSLIIKQFRGWVSGWGYRVQWVENPLMAVSKMLTAIPAVVFIDINMPGINGFELVKKIRRQPKLASVPLVMLTAERTLNNNWRSQWSGCKFLTKPLQPEEIPLFQRDLKALLQEVAPLKFENLVVDRDHPADEEPA